MEFSTKFSIAAKVHHIIVSDPVVALIDNETTIRFIDPASEKQIKSQPFGYPVEHELFKGNSSSGDGKNIIIYSPEEIKTYLYGLDETSREYVKRTQLDWLVSACEVSVFSPDSSLFATGGNDGRVSIYSCDNAKLLTIPPKQNEYICAISFNYDNSQIAYTSFNKNLIIFDLSRNRISNIFLHKDIINVMAFMHRSSFLIIASRDNKVSLYDTINGYIAKDLITTVNWPIAIYVDKNDQFAFVSDKAGYLYMIDLSLAEQEASPVFHSEVNIVDIKSRGEEIYFAFADGAVAILDLAAERGRFDELLQSGKTAEILELMQQNPILKFSASGFVDNMDERYDELFSKAIVLLASGKADQAKDAMGDILTYPIYKKRYESVTRHSSKVVTFWNLIQSSQYQDAYNMANEGDFYKKLPLFRMLEERFENRFKDSVKALVSGADPKTVREGLLPFMRVPIKEAVIKNMLKNPEIFNKAQNVFDRKDYKELAAMLDKFKMLRGAPAINAYQEMIKGEEVRFLSFMAAGKFEEALEPAKFLKENAKIDNPSIMAEFARLGLVEQFKQIVKEKKYGEAMQIALANPFLITSNAYRELDQMLSLRFKAAHVAASRNQFEQLDKLVRVFLKSEFSRARAIGAYKSIYIEQILAMGAKMQQKHWINTLKNYVARFGVDEELELVTKRFDQDKLLEPFRKFERPSFLHYPLIPNIVTTPFAKPQPKKG